VSKTFFKRVEAIAVFAHGTTPLVTRGSTDDSRLAIGDWRLATDGW
jgi:hypothetical protein